MASEVVSYMIIFSLGITMVIAIGFTMINLTDSVSETTADVQMNQILFDMKEMILQEINSFSYNGSFSYSLALNIPTALSVRYLYEITIQEDDGYYHLVGTSEGIGSAFIITVPLWLSTNEAITISGTIKSHITTPSILFHKNIFNNAFITLEN